MEELKKCPFCGGEAKVVTGVTRYVPSHPYCYVACKICKTTSNSFTDTNNDGKFIDRAIEVWNKRVYEIGTDMAQGEDMTVYYRLNKEDSK